MRDTVAVPEIVSYVASDQDEVERFFEETWAGGRFPFEPAEAHADLRAIQETYQSQGGGFWLLRLQARIIGTVALRRLDARTAELKRFNVLPGYRGNGHGRRLIEFALSHARAENFECVRLDTIREPGPAMRLYERLGFGEIDRYNENPDADLFMELKLDVH